MSSTPDSPSGGRTPVVVHGHFYQPPREDPWTGRLPDRRSAAPYPNWNIRISHECYEPLAEIGAFEWMSFDAGPTLLRWLERERLQTYEALLAGDRASRERIGHGNAVAQPFHHVILPLASPREKALEIAWGLADFERRFGRPAQGMWLPEAAVDRASLEALADAGVRFTILAPHQVAEPPPSGVGRVVLGGGREIAVFVYDGDLAHGVAFGDLLRDADRWMGRMEEMAAGRPGILSLATDGETFGHHHAGAESVLAEVIDRLAHHDALELTSYEAVLASQVDLVELELVEPSSWSCSHGVERWRSDCGCRMAPERDWTQAWRAPLRDALRHLADRIHAVYDDRAPARFDDPWAALLGLAGPLAGDPAERDRYLAEAASANGEGGKEASALLGMVLNAGAMFTSCGWFFDEIARLEPRQVLRYAARAIERLGAVDPALAREAEARLIEDLARAPSNDPEVGDGARLYEHDIRAPHPLPSGPADD